MRQVAGKRRNRVFFEGRQRSTDGGLPPLMRPSRILPTRGRFLFHRRGTTDRVKNGRSLGQRVAMIDRPCQSNRLTSVGIPTAGCFGKSESTPRDAGGAKGDEGIFACWRQITRSCREQERHRFPFRRPAANLKESTTQRPADDGGCGEQSAAVAKKRFLVSRRRTGLGNAEPSG
jgi:hypothetical protein